MKRSVVETILGAVILAVAAVFLAFSYNTSNVQKVTGYKVLASFSSIGGLDIGDAVLISGVKVGSVTDVQLNMDTYYADVYMDIDPSIEIPEDTAAVITGESLLGGKVLYLEPGGSMDMLKDGDRITFTQAPQNLEQLLGKFIFSVSGNNDDDDSNDQNL